MLMAGGQPGGEGGLGAAGTDHDWGIIQWHRKNVEPLTHSFPMNLSYQIIL